MYDANIVYCNDDEYDCDNVGMVIIMTGLRMITRLIAVMGMVVLVMTMMVMLIMMMIFFFFFF